MNTFQKAEETPVKDKYASEGLRPLLSTNSNTLLLELCSTLGSSECLLGEVNTVLTVLFCSFPFSLTNTSEIIPKMTVPGNLRNHVFVGHVPHFFSTFFLSEYVSKMYIDVISACNTILNSLLSFDINHPCSELRAPYTMGMQLMKADS